MLLLTLIFLFFFLEYFAHFNMSWGEGQGSTSNEATCFTFSFFPKRQDKKTA